MIVVLAIISGCGAFAGKEDTGTVIARRAQVRSSTAVVAADLKEVTRGDMLDILGSTTAEGERWLRVRTREAEGTEGWIEARNIMPQEMLDRSRQLAKEDEGIPAQASGQLRASTNIRLSPDRGGNDNILMKLESGSRFEIIGWKRVSKPRSSETSESDDAPKAGAAQQSSKKNRATDESKELEDVNELWFKVRLPQSISPAPSGWIYGKQVELTVPSDIIFYRTGREFVAWQRLDADAGEVVQASFGSKDGANDTRPGSWVILEKSSVNETNHSNMADFDRIFVLGYDKEKQEHYTAYRSPDIQGILPLRIEGRSEDKTFMVRVQSEEQLKEMRFRAHRDNRGVLRVTALNELPKGIRKGR